MHEGTDMRNTTWRALICLWLVGTLLAGPVAAQAGDGLFSRLKARAAQKIEQVKDPVWVKTKLASSAASGIAGRITGFAGMTIGATIGLAIGGPVGAAVGGMIGAEVASSMTKAYVRPLTAGLVEARLTDRPTTVAEVWKSLDKKKLAVEGASDAVGSVIGKAVGMAIGAALFAGTGPIALPILGVIGGDIIGGKIGKWIGSKLVKKAGVMAYTALAAQPPPASGTTEPVPMAAGETPAAAPAPSASLTAAQATYEQAYRAYVTAVQDPAATSETKAHALRAYTVALDAWIAARGAANPTR
mgnify:CR=1 FL=1